MKKKRINLTIMLLLPCIILVGNHNYKGLRTSNKEKIEYLDSIYGFTPLITSIDSLTFYIISDEHSAYRLKNVGLVNKDLNIVLKKEYSKILNPDATVKYHMEIEKNGKYGLYNYISNKVLNPIFDFIIPFSNKSNIAIGSINKELFYINKVLEYTRIDDNEMPQLSDILNISSFSFPSQKTIYWYNSYKSDSYNPSEERQAGAFCPSYLKDYKYFPDFKYYALSVDGYDDEAYVSKKDSLGLNNSHRLDFVKVMRKYIPDFDIRQYNDEYYFITTSNNKNYRVKSNLVFKIEQDNHGRLNGKYYSSNLINDSIIKICYQRSRIRSEEFETMTKIVLYKVEKNGTINKLESERRFDFTKFAIIDSSYFVGEFKRKTGESDRDNNGFWKEYFEVTKHLSIEDLDIMRNEIFAVYGYKFKTKKWQDYFSRQNWYLPKFDNVDKFLTDIDRKNIQFILKYKQQMINNEDEYLQKTQEVRTEDSAG